MDFASDNTGGLAPAIQAALARASAGHAAAYGGDEGSARLDAAFGVLFETEVRVFPVLSGTAANALALAHLLPPWGAVLCHADAHIQTDECGAPEFFSAGAKLLTLPGDHGRIDPAALAARLDAPASAHQVQPAVLSLSQATEAGTCYAAARPCRLRRGCARQGPQGAHGRRPLRQRRRRAGAEPRRPDVAGGGGRAVVRAPARTAGMMAEAVVFFDPALAEGFDRRRKRAGQLMAKGRFLAAQLLASIEDGLWLRPGRTRQWSGVAAGGRAGGARGTFRCIRWRPTLFSCVCPSRWPRRCGTGAHDFMIGRRWGRRAGVSSPPSPPAGEEVDRLIELARVG